MPARSTERLGKIEAQHINCNLCGGDDTLLVDIQNEYMMVECRLCGLVYVDPQPSAGHLKVLYDSYHEREGKNGETWQRLMASNFSEAACTLDYMLPDRGKILDIGCGYGHFIEMMRDRGWTASGIEPSEAAGKYAIARGLDVGRTVIEDASIQDDSFDAVTAFYVLEHLTDPLAALKKMREILRPGGVLVLRVPHTTPLVKALRLARIENNLYDLPFHLYDFSPATIKSMLTKAGFTDIEISPGQPTCPPAMAERLAALFSGNTARLLHYVSGGRILLPGVSKTAICRKHSEAKGQARA